MPTPSELSVMSQRISMLTRDNQILQKAADDGAVVVEALKEDNRRLRELVEEARQSRDNARNDAIQQLQSEMADLRKRLGNISREIPLTGEVAMGEMKQAVSHLVGAIGQEDAMREVALWLTSLVGSQDRQQVRRFEFEVVGMVVTVRPLGVPSVPDEYQPNEKTVAELIGRNL